MAARKDNDREIVISRLIHAPRDLVFKVWTDADHIKEWWGPNGFTNTIHEMNVKPGGVFRFMMHGPDNMNFPNKIVYTEVVKPEKLVYVHSDDEGSQRFDVTVTFEVLKDSTLLTMRTVFSTAAERERVIKEVGAIEGGNQTLDHLQAYVAAQRGEFIITRRFKFPPQLMFDAFTKSEHMHQWWGPKGSTVIKAEMNLRPGGINHYGLRMPDGSAMWGKSVYREITPTSRLVYVQSFSDEAGNIAKHPMSPTWPREMLTVITFEETGEGTQLTIQWSPVNATDEERATFNSAMSGMNQGWTGSLDQLEQYLAGIKH